MLNVCFGDSECGLMKYALKGNKTETSYMYLGYGAIDSKNFEKSREEWLGKIYPGCSLETIKELANDERQRFDRIMRIARQEKELRIWCSNNPNSKCGLYHLSHSLRDVDCKIFVVEMPDEVSYRDTGWDNCWAQADVIDIVNCLSLQREIDKDERNQYVQMWEKLVRENSELRVNIDGIITSVEVYYLDREILSRIEVNKEVKLGYFVGEAIGKSRYHMMAGFTESRIEAMIAQGLIAVVNRDYENNYSTIVRVVSH